MKPLFKVTRIAFLPLLGVAFAACNERSVTGQHQAPASKTSERAAPPESDDRRRVREMLGTVTIPLVDFEQTSAEEGAEYVRIRVKEIAPEKAVEIEVRRPMPRSEDGKIIRGEACIAATLGELRVTPLGRHWNEWPVTTGWVSRWTSGACV